MVVNFWLVGQVESFLSGLVLSQFEVNRARFVYSNMYLRYDNLSDLVPIREAIQEAPNVDCWGMWAYEDGQPIGGVGSPWFQTPPIAQFEDFLLTGQFPRSFV